MNRYHLARLAAATVIGLIASELAARANTPDSPPIDLSDPHLQLEVRLDDPGQILEQEPVREQTFDDCYGEAAAVLWDAMLKHLGMYDAAHPTSGAWLALAQATAGYPKVRGTPNEGALLAQSLGGRNGDTKPWGLVYKPDPKSREDPKSALADVSNYVTFIDYGDSTRAAGAPLYAASGAPIYAASEALLETGPAPAEGLALCDRDAMTWFEQKQDLLAAWKDRASKTEWESVLDPSRYSAAKAQGVKPEAHAIVEKAWSTCEKNFARYRVAPEKKAIFRILASGPDDVRVPFMIDVALAAQIPVAVELCDDPLLGSSGGLTFDASLLNLAGYERLSEIRKRCNRLHAVVLEGRRLIMRGEKPELEYLFHNQWGHNCPYVPEVAAECEPDKGAFWLSSDHLFEIGISYTFVYALYGREPDFDRWEVPGTWKPAESRKPLPEYKDRFAYLGFQNKYVYDKTNDLTWMRCPLGTVSTGPVCLGKPVLLGHDEAAAWGTSGWRLPTRDEWKTLLLPGEDQETNAASNAYSNVLQPVQAGIWFWAADASEKDPTRYVDLDPNDGDTSDNAQSGTDFVILVKSGRP